MGLLSIASCSYFNGLTMQLWTFTPMLATHGRHVCVSFPPPVVGVLRLMPVRVRRDPRFGLSCFLLWFARKLVHRQHHRCHPNALAMHYASLKVKRIDRQAQVNWPCLLRGHVLKEIGISF